MLTFLVFAVLMAAPLGLSMNHQIIVMCVSLYALVMFIALGGIFSVRVAMLCKNSTKVIK
ncbi:cytochrome b6 [Neisseria yangbaofengii]|uniref:cytochrome b6 n=1 Tax=Neisseria yangbaofengii TaxID=2709396 RepID=UPI001D018C1B|nr:cytochrome b6 [Neisseria yangbaofengii]